MEYHKRRIKEILKANPRGMTITEISDRININRNSVARYMDILTISGQVEMRQLGPAKLFYLSQRVPLSAMLNFSSDYILVLDEDLKIIQINENLLELINTKREAILDRSLEDFPNPSFISQEMFSRTKEALKGKEINFEKKFQIDKLELYLNIGMLPTIFEDGSKGATWILHDITEQKKAEKILATEKKKFETYLNLARVMMIAIDAEGKVTFVNKKTCEILGYNKKDIIGKDWFNNFLPKRIRKETKQVSNLLFSGNIKPADYHENPILTKNGKERLIAWHNILLEDEKGRIIGHLSSGEDITEHRITDNALKESEKKFRAYLENSPEYSYIISPEGKILEINRSALETLGYSKKELLGKPLLSTVYAPSSQKKAKKIFEMWKKSGKIQDEELEIITKLGEKRTVLLSAHSVKDDDGRLLHSVSVQRDITNRKSLEEDLKEANWLCRERVKELAFLYKAIREMQKSESLEDLGPKLVDFLGPAMQFPEIAVPLLEIEGARFVHKNYREDLTYGIFEEICINNHTIGRVAVYYTEDRPFIIPQEQDMLKALAETLGGWFKNKGENPT